MRAYLRHIASFSTAAKLFLAGEFLDGVGHGTFIVLRNLYLKKCGLDEGFIGQTMSMSAFGTMVVTVPLALFMDVGRLRGYLVAGTLAAVAGLVGTALWPTPGPLLASSFISGAGLAFLGVGAAPFYMRHSSPEERPFLFGVGMAIGPLSGLIGAALVWSLSLAWGETVAAQRNILLTAAAIALVSLAAFAMLREGPVSAAPRERHELALGKTIKLCVPAFIIGLGAGLTIPFINLYFEHRFHQSAKTISAIFSAAQVLTFVAFLAAPVIGRRFGGVRAIVASQLLSLPFFLVMAFTQSLGLAIAGFLARHALMNMTGPVQSNFAMEVVPERQRALTNGMREISWCVAWMIATVLGGWIVKHSSFVRDGYTVTMLITIAFYVIGSVMFWALWRNSTALAAPSAKVEAVKS